MGMTPEEFFEAFVLGNYEDYKKHPGCLRRSFNAAVSASQLADHYYNYCKRHDPEKVKCFNELKCFLKHLSKETNGGFEDIRSISNAYKHLYTRGHHSTVSSTGAIERINMVTETVKEIEQNYCGPAYSETTVVYTRKDGSQLEFLPVLEAVISYWEKSGVLHGS